MRLLFLALMIALLPVRGLMGNAMAVDMASQTVAQAQKASAGNAIGEVGTQADSSAPSSMPEDCPMSAQSGTGKSVSASESGEPDSSCNCNSCELCMSLASFDFSTVVAGAFVPPAGLTSRVIRFSSAERVFNLKPPIS